MYLLPELDHSNDLAFESASLSIGQPSTDWFAAQLAMDADEWESSGNGDSVSLVSVVTDSDRVAFAVLHSAYVSRIGFPGAPSSSGSLDVDQWTESTAGTCFLVFTDDRGFHSVEWFATEDEARSKLREIGAAWHEDEDED